MAGKVVRVQRQNRTFPFLPALPLLNHVRRRPSPGIQIDLSRQAQLASIEQSFAGANDHFSLEATRHPTKPHLTAVESYPVLPDEDIWANQYDLFRFSERPGGRPPEACLLILNSSFLNVHSSWTILAWTAPS